MIVLVAVCSLLLMVTGSAQAKEAYVDDYNTGAKPNSMGGDLGAFDFQPTDFTQSCTEAYDPDVKHGDSGFSLRLDYDVDSTNPAYNGFWTKLNSFNATDYNKIVLWIKGDADKGYTTTFKAELKNDQGEKGEYYVTGVIGDWMKIEIPLDRFAGITNLSSLSEFVIVFEDLIATSKEGTIWIDDIYFSD